VENTRRECVGTLRRAKIGGLGYGDVRTHLQSGNAVFHSSHATARKLEAQMAAKLDTELGLDVKVLVRSVDDLVALVDSNPFIARRVDPKELHLAFLSKAPPSSWTLATTGC